MNVAEFTGIVKSGSPVILRRRSNEYIRLSENGLSVVRDNCHLTLWLASNRKFKRVLTTLASPGAMEPFRETHRFLEVWKEIREARQWSPHSFPDLNEIAAFVYLTLIPEYWTIYLEREGQEPLPLIEHESLHADTGGYDN